MKRQIVIGGILCMVLLVTACSSLDEKGYYLSHEGSDANDGSMKNPWKTVQRVNQTSLKPGDQIFLQGGDIFKGPLILSREMGTAEKRILLTSYGNGKAILEADSENGMVIENCSFVTVQNLRILGSGRLSNNGGNGLEILHSSKVRVRNIDVSGFRNAGCRISGSDSILLEKVHAHSNGFCGIATDHKETTSRIVVRDCLAENNAGDPTIRDNHSGSGILLASVKKGTVEFCEARYNGWDMPRTGNGPVGIWSWNSDSLTIQHCLSHHNKSPDFDGGGFDLDGGVTNSVVQYNFSHHNSGSGFMLCQFTGAPRPLANNHIRFNVSFDDGLSNHFAGIMIYAGGENFTGSWIYNNTIVNTLHSAVNFDGIPVYLKNPPVVEFYNNIFISGKEQITNLSLVPGTVLRGNLYWAYGDGGFSIGNITDFALWTESSSFEKTDGKITGMYCDPMLSMALENFPSSPRELMIFSAFRPLPGSPALHAGIDISGRTGIERGDSDFQGKPLEKNQAFAGAYY